MPEVTQSINRKLCEVTASHFSNAVMCLERVELNASEHVVLHNPSQLEASVLGKLGCVKMLNVTDCVGILLSKCCEFHQPFRKETAPSVVTR